MRNDRAEELTSRNLPDGVKHGTRMNKAPEARESGKIFKHIQIHKYYELYYHMSALLSSRPLYAFSLTLDPL